MQFTAGSPGNTLSQQTDFLDISSPLIQCILNNRATLSSTTVPQRLYSFLLEQSGSGASFEHKVYFLSVFTWKNKYFNVLVRYSACCEQKGFRYSLQKANKITSVLFLDHQHKFKCSENSVLHFKTTSYTAQKAAFLFTSFKFSLSTAYRKTDEESSNSECRLYVLIIYA